MCCTEKVIVIDLVNHPVVSLSGTRMRGTSTKVVTKRVYLELPPTQADGGLLTGIWAPIDMSKKVCQRLGDLHLYGET